jgi:hypothetical protein
MEKVLKYRSLDSRRVASFEQLENRNLAATDWQNPILPCDVDNSGIVAPIDALVVINTGPSGISVGPGLDHRSKRR